MSLSSAAVLQTQISAIMEVLAQAAVAEISQLLEEDAAALHLEIQRRNEEIQALKTRLLITENKLQRATADSCSIGIQVEIMDTSTPALQLGVSVHSQEPHPDDLSQQKLGSVGPLKNLITEEKPHHSHTLELKGEDPITCSSHPEEEELSGLEFEMKIEQVEERVDQKPSQETEQKSQNRDDVHSHSWSSKTFDDPESLIEAEQHSQTFPDPYAMMEDPTAQSSSGLFSFSQNQSFGASGDVEYGLNLHGQERSSGTDSTTFSASHSNSCPAKTLSQRPYAETHPGTKPFRCEECGKSFTQRTRLITHRRVHTGEKPFRCQLCGKTFSRQDNCLRHVRLHSGQRW